MKCSWLFAAALVIAPGRAVAQSERPNVELRIAPSGDSEQRLRDVLDELLGRQPVEVHYEGEASIDPREAVTPRAEATKAVARVWVDLGNPRRATIYLVDQHWERVLIRHVRTRDNDEVTREEIAHIIASAVEALRDGATLGVTRAEAHRTLGLRQEEKPSPAPTPQETIRAGIGVFYEAQSWSLDEPLFHGPGVALYGDSGSRNFRPGLWLSGQFRFPVDIEREPVGLRVESGSLRLLGSISIPFSARAWFRAGLGAGLDLVDIATQLEHNAPFKADAARLTLVPLARSMVFLGYRIGLRTHAFLALSADLDLVKSRYFVQRGESTETVFSPWRLRPAVLLGVAADILTAE